MAVASERVAVSIKYGVLRKSQFPVMLDRLLYEWRLEIGKMITRILIAIKWVARVNSHDDETVSVHKRGSL